MRVGFHTLGCKVNQYETEAIREIFQKKGHQASLSEDPVGNLDAYIINTCTVTNMADKKSRQLIRRVKKENPKCIVAVMGCYSQVSPQEVSQIKEVDIVIGNQKKEAIVIHIEELYEKNMMEEDLDKTLFRQIGKIEDQIDFEELGIEHGMESRTRAYVKIQEGCNRFCSYCIIPYARGPIRSRKKENIIKEIEALVEKGYKEIVLTGINTALYGMENTVPQKAKSVKAAFHETENREAIRGTFSETEEQKKPEENHILPLEKVLEDIEKIKGEFRVRLSSLEPTVVNQNQVENLLKFKKLCRHLHLSMQSGSDRVLKEMNRNYTGAEYLSIIKAIRKKYPLFGISADVIVGFPGETEEEFCESMRTLEEGQLCKTHIFKYSKRTGTKAASMGSQIGEKEKGARSKRLIELSEMVAKKFNSNLVGTTQKVLVEKIQHQEGLLEGYTDNYVKAYIAYNNSNSNSNNNNIEKARGESQGANPSERYMGQFVEVRVTKTYEDGVKGELI